MLDLEVRCMILEGTFDKIQSTNSIIEKRSYIEDMPTELDEDFETIIKVLTGEIKFGFTMPERLPTYYGIEHCEFTTVTEAINCLLEPSLQHDLSNTNVLKHLLKLGGQYSFFVPIVNRILKLGIGKSLLGVADTAPMLAKKFEGKLKYNKYGYSVTEKLDGNRCIAYYNNGWKFVSRNGKLMHVNFNMDGLPKEYIYDGEVLSYKQVEMSKYISNVCKVELAGKTVSNIIKFDDMFNSTSGIINAHSGDKKLIYNIFDIMSNDEYKYRREELDKLRVQMKDETDVRILPTLIAGSVDDILAVKDDLINIVTAIGGEGLMINDCDAGYVHKRTNDILKVKKVFTMDMKVVSMEYGTGKYEGAIGALWVEAEQDGKYISCKVGSGLSDEQRFDWAADFDKIYGRIVEIAYFSLSQDQELKGTNRYSLRFPRLISVRTDKNTTSLY